VDVDPVALRIDAHTGLAHHRAVDADRAGFDQQVALAASAEPARGQQLVEPDRWRPGRPRGGIGLSS
jgi:hypothetical protein